MAYAPARLVITSGFSVPILRLKFASERALQLPTFTDMFSQIPRLFPAETPGVLVESKPMKVEQLGRPDK